MSEATDGLYGSPPTTRTEAWSPRPSASMTETVEKPMPSGRHAVSRGEGAALDRLAIDHPSDRA